MISQWLGKTSCAQGRLGELLRREGADPKVLEMFYRAVIHAILLFGDETCLLSVGFSLEDHREEGAMLTRKYTGDAWGGISAGGGGNTVGDDLHRETAGNRSTVGSVEADIRMCAGEKG